MSEEEKMFQIGCWALVLIAVLTAILQVCYRTQKRMLNNVRAQIVETQQDIAVAKTNFASYVRPEILRNLVISITPDAEPISFHKNISVDKLESNQDISAQ